MVVVNNKVMPYYQHDMLHCKQLNCNKKDTCYRYWLGQNCVKHGYQYCFAFMPKEPIIDGCDLFLDIKNY